MCCGWTLSGEPVGAEGSEADIVANKLGVMVDRVALSCATWSLDV